MCRLRGGRAVNMGKADILGSLDSARRQLNSYQWQKKELEEKYSVMCEFGRQCALHENSFRASISKRKQRLSGIDGLLHNVKSAVRYKQKMQDMLTGSEYSAAEANIDRLQMIVLSEKKRICSELQYVEQQIRMCGRRVDSLQYEYDHYEEVNPNG